MGGWVRGYQLHRFVHPRLGELACVWRSYAPMCDDGRIAETLLTLLRSRAACATVCPSEVARALAPTDWRPLMPQVRAVAATLAAVGEVELRQRGQAIVPFSEVRGPLRIALAPQRDPHGAAGELLN